MDKKTTNKIQTNNESVIIFFSIDAKIPVAIKAAKLPHFYEVFQREKSLKQAITSVRDVMRHETN
jgi:hypothetical protein